MDLQLSELYDGEGDIEVTAHMINVNAGHNADLLGRCRPLADYSELIRRIRVNLNLGHTKEEAVSMAIDSCIKDGILESILREERAKVTNILINGLTEEQVKKLHEWEIQQSREEGHKEEIVHLLNDGDITEETALRRLECSKEDLGKYIEKYSK